MKAHEVVINSNGIPSIKENEKFPNYLQNDRKNQIFQNTLQSSSYQTGECF